MNAFFKRASRSRKSKESKNEPVPTAELQNQPSSILTLNDDCLYAILVYLDIPNLCHTVDVCRRFRSISEQAFHFKYKTDSYFAPSFRREICKFGHLVTKFHLDAYKYKVDGIGKYSSTRLKYLRLLCITINCDQIASVIPRLKYLSISHCNLNKHKNWDAVFRDCPELEVLIFKQNFYDRKKYRRYDFLVQHFPKLEQFECWARSDTIVGFLHLNPQLKKLNLWHTNDKIIDAIAEYVKDIEELELNLMPDYGVKSMFEKKASESGLLCLSKLKKLKTLKLSSFHPNEYRLDQLMKHLSKESIPLETIDLNPRGPSILKDFASLKTLRYVQLCSITEVKDMDLIILIAELPLLSKLVITSYDGSESMLTVNGLIRMTNAGMNLVEMILGGFHFEETLHNYNSLLKTVQNREKKLKIVCIFDYAYKVLLKVPANTLFANKEHLEFIK